MHKLNLGVPLLLVAVLAAHAPAQSTLDWPVGEFQTYYLDSGTLANSEDDFVLVYSTAVSVEAAAWLRLYFSEVELDANSFIRITSALDDAVQELDADGIAMWNDSSAYFNGNTVYLELIAGPNTTGNHLVLDQVALEQEGGPRACGASGCGYCGEDNRVPSDEDWAGRLLPAGCTGSIFNHQSCAVSAGHCIGGSMILQFRVPDSNPNCNLNHPGPQDQFSITGTLFQNGGVGADWAVMTTGTNSLGQTPYERYDVSRPIASQPAGGSDAATVWGFGVDDSPSPTRNQTQQTHTGSIGAVESDHYRIYVDITFGNSGSSVIVDDEIVGIVTHCPCPNSATRTDLPAFEAAREQLCGGPENDNCQNAFDACPGTTAGSSIDADSDGSANCGTSASSPDVWYRYTPDADGTLTLETCSGSDYDTVLSIHTGCPGTPGNQIGCDDDGCSGGNKSLLSVSVTQGAVYYIRVSGYDGASGDFTLDVSGPICGVPDTTPPEPTVMEWESEPAPLSTSELTMTGVEAFDTESPPVEYFFLFTGSDGNGGDNSGWQPSRTYIDDGLDANTVYSYKVAARDALFNVGDYSFPAAAAATYIETPIGISFANVGDTFMDVTAGDIFSHLTGDQTGQPPNQSGIYFEMTPAHGSGANVWVTTETISVAGLTPETEYTFNVRARNYFAVETAVFGPVSQSTTGVIPCPLMGDVNQDGSVNGLDVGGFVRAKLGLPPEPGENPACAEYGGTLQEDIDAFIADLLID